jgi:hypothetical protein
MMMLALLLILKLVQSPYLYLHLLDHVPQALARPALVEWLFAGR